MPYYIHFYLKAKELKKAKTLDSKLRQIRSKRLLPLLRFHTLSC